MEMVRNKGRSFDDNSSELLIWKSNKDVETIQPFICIKVLHNNMIIHIVTIIQELVDTWSLNYISIVHNMALKWKYALLLSIFIRYVLTFQLNVKLLDK